MLRGARTANTVVGLPTLYAGWVVIRIPIYVMSVVVRHQLGEQDLPSFVMLSVKKYKNSSTRC